MRRKLIKITSLLALLLELNQIDYTEKSTARADQLADYIAIDPANWQVSENMSSHSIHDVRAQEDALSTLEV